MVMTCEWLGFLSNGFLFKGWKWRIKFEDGGLKNPSFEGNDYEPIKLNHGKVMIPFTFRLFSSHLFSTSLIRPASLWVPRNSMQSRHMGHYVCVLSFFFIGLSFSLFIFVGVVLPLIHVVGLQIWMIYIL